MTATTNKRVSAIVIGGVLCIVLHSDKFTGTSAAIVMIGHDPSAADSDCSDT